VLGVAGLSACQAPVGMYGHRPAELWMLPSDATPVPPPRCAYQGQPIVLKRLENASRAPVGAHFFGAQPSANSMLQAYAPAGDLSVPIFEAAYASLRAARFPVWKDYTPSPEVRHAPPGSAAFTVVHGIVEELEVSTFDVADQLQPDEAARAKIVLTVEDREGKVKKRFVAEPKVRLRRGSGDVLVALGQQVARQIAEVFNAGL
jgi:hypothetical protein